MDEHWVIDADASYPPEMLAWSPLDPDTGSVVTGLLVLQAGYVPPREGRFAGVYHQDGQEAVERWCKRYAETVERCIAARDEAERVPQFVDSPIVVCARAGE